MTRSPRPRISVVVTACNEGRHLRRTVECLRATLPAGSEIVVVDDGSTDRCAAFLARNHHGVRLIRSNHLGVAKARNFGAAQSRGKVIVFADGHIEVPGEWWPVALELLRNPSIGGVAPAITVMGNTQVKGYGLRLQVPEMEAKWLEPRGKRPHPVPLAPGCCLAMRRDTFARTGGFDPGMVRWGSSDNELGVRLWLLGYELWVAPQIEVAHFFREKPPYPVDYAEVLHNMLRLALVHFNASRVAAVLQTLRRRREFPGALARLVTGDFAQRRRELLGRRVHDDDWFFRKFRKASPG